MKITAQTMELSGLTFTIERSTDSWSVDIYREETEDTKRERIFSGYLTFQELEALYDLFFKAKYLAQEVEKGENNGQQ